MENGIGITAERKLEGFSVRTVDLCGLRNKFHLFGPDMDEKGREIVEPIGGFRIEIVDCAINHEGGHSPGPASSTVIGGEYVVEIVGENHQRARHTIREAIEIARRFNRPAPVRVIDGRK